LQNPAAAASDLHQRIGRGAAKVSRVTLAAGSSSALPPSSSRAAAEGSGSGSRNSNCHLPASDDEESDSMSDTSDDASDASDEDIDSDDELGQLARIMQRCVDKCRSKKGNRGSRASCSGSVQGGGQRRRKPTAAGLAAAAAGGFDIDEELSEGCSEEAEQLELESGGSMSEDDEADDPKVSVMCPACSSLLNLRSPRRRVRVCTRSCRCLRSLKTASMLKSSGWQ
jgi:hypothetical protein